MKKIIFYTIGFFFLIIAGSSIFFFFAGEIKNTFQFDDARFVSIQKFIKQGKAESLSQAKLQLDLIADDYKPDSTLILKNELNLIALSQAKASLQKKKLGSCEKYLDLIDNDYQPQEVEIVKQKLYIAVNEESYEKVKKYIKERNIDKAKVYFSKIDSTYKSKKIESLEKKLYSLENELIIEEAVQLMNEKNFEEAEERLADVPADFDPKKRESLQEEIQLKSELEDLLNDEGAIVVFVDFVKNEMNDPDSFEHVKTLISEKGKYLQVNMKYRENNSYGAKVLKSIDAKLNRDGSVKKVMNQKG